MRSLKAEMKGENSLRPHYTFGESAQSGDYEVGGDRIYCFPYEIFKYSVVIKFTLFFISKRNVFFRWDQVHSDVRCFGGFSFVGVLLEVWKEWHMFVRSEGKFYNKEMLN